MLPPTSGFFPPFPIRRNNRFQHLETAVTIIGNDRYLYWEQCLPGLRSADQRHFGQFAQIHRRLRF